MDEFNDVLIKLPEFDANLKLPDPNLRDFYLDEKKEFSGLVIILMMKL